MRSFYLLIVIESRLIVFVTVPIPSIKLLAKQKFHVSRNIDTSKRGILQGNIKFSAVLLNFYFLGRFSEARVLVPKKELFHALT